MAASMRSAVLLLLAALSLCVHAASAAALSSVLTAQGSSARLTPQPDTAFTSAWDSNADTLSFYPSRRFQSILGFGGAFTEASAVNIAALTPALQSEVMAAYFDKKAGHGYNCQCLNPSPASQHTNHCPAAQC